MLLKFIERSGQETWINSENVVAIRALNKTDGRTEIQLVNGAFIYSNEDVDAIVNTFNSVAKSGCGCK